MGQMAGGVTKYKTGSFIGDGVTVTRAFDIGFEPDVFIIHAVDLQADVAGWVGIYDIVIVKNTITYFARHGSSASTALNVTVHARVGGSYPPYGDGSEAYAVYGSYIDGIFTCTNRTNATFTRFVDGVTYKWEAIAK